MLRQVMVAFAAVTVLLVTPSPSDAKHSWNDYHWERSTNPFDVTLGDNLSGGDWDSILGSVSTDWSEAGVLDSPVGSGTNAALCTDPLGDVTPTFATKVEVCNDTYGKNGWLGVARIWLDSDGSGHIVASVAAMNDSYLFEPGGTYNDAVARRHVACQEIGHAFGLDHQARPHDQSCMNDRWGLFSTDYQSPNQHDYDQLASIYGHDDSSTGGDGGDGGDGGGPPCDKKPDHPKCQGGQSETFHVGQAKSGHTVLTWILRV